jgi:hypothetical protein
VTLAANSYIEDLTNFANSLKEELLKRLETFGALASIELGRSIAPLLSRITSDFLPRPTALAEHLDN